MPELPEVETIRRGLSLKILHKPIAAVQIRKRRLVVGRSQAVIKFLVGQRIVAIERIGKLLIFKLSLADKYMLVHLRMTGQLIYQDKDTVIAGGHNFPKIENLPNKYSHIIIRFKDGAHLYFNDLRQFGYIQIVGEKEKNKIRGHFGLEPLDREFNWLNFQKIFLGKKTKLKALLLNQEHIAGIGNIYADEICWRAQILPWRETHKISTLELKKLFSASQKILTQAIAKGGTTFSDYRTAEGKRGGYRAYLKVYGRQNLKCKRCGHPIQKKKSAGRGTHFCGYCQK